MLKNVIKRRPAGNIEAVSFGKGSQERLLNLPSLSPDGIT